MPDEERGGQPLKIISITEAKKIRNENAIRKAERQKAETQRRKQEMEESINQTLQELRDILSKFKLAISQEIVIFEKKAQDYFTEINALQSDELYDFAEYAKFSKESKAHESGKLLTFDGKPPKAIFRGLEIYKQIFRLEAEWKQTTDAFQKLLDDWIETLSKVYQRNSEKWRGRQVYPPISDLLHSLSSTIWSTISEVRTYKLNGNTDSWSELFGYTGSIRDIISKIAIALKTIPDKYESDEL